MGFDKDFGVWLEKSLSKTVPASVTAFSFNLNETDSSQFPFSVELIGSPFFDAEDDDWACEEIWHAVPRSLVIPETFSSKSWETCLENIKALVLKTLHDDTAGEILRTRYGIAVGFVSGDLDLVWRK